MATPGLAGFIAGGAEAIRGGGVKDILGSAGRAAALDVSPGFRAFEELNLRRAKSIRMDKRLQMDREAYEQENRLLPLDGITRKLGARASKDMVQLLTDEELLERDPETGALGIRANVGQKRLDEFKQDKPLQLEFAKDNLLDINDLVSRNTKAKELKVEEIVRKKMKEAGVTEAPGTQLFTELRRGILDDILVHKIVGQEDLIGFDKEDELLRARRDSATQDRNRLEDLIAQETAPKSLGAIEAGAAERLQTEEGVSAIESVRRVREGTKARTPVSLGIDFNKKAQELFPGRLPGNLTGQETALVNAALENVPFEQMKPPNRITLAAIATDVSVPNPFKITKQQALNILKELDKSRAFAFLEAIEDVGGEVPSVSDIEKIVGKIPILRDFIGKKGKKGKTKDALSTVGTGE